MRIQRKYHSITFILYLILFGGFLLVLPSCTPERVNKITYISDVIWFSENPTLEILILKENSGRGFGFIYDNNIKTDIYFRWGFTQFSFCLAEEYNIVGSTLDKFLSGQYARISDTEATLTIDSGYLFDGKYLNQTFTIKSKDIDRDNLDIKYYTNVQWTATAPTLTFHILPEERRRGVGEIEYDNITHDILFYWEDDSKFSVYELQGDIQSESPILTGTYTSSNLKATLTIEDDLVFNHEFKTIELIAKGLNDP